MKILILSCSTGEGHNSAARAISERLNDINIENEILDPIGLKSLKAKNIVSDCYNKLIKRFPLGFGFIYNLGRLYEKTKLPSPVYYANTKYVKELYEYIKDNNYDIVICTHLYCMLAMTELNKRYNHVKSYGILTDYTVIPFFLDAKMDGYFVANQKCKQVLVDNGIDEKIVYCTGIPVNNKFNIKIDKEKIKSELGIKKDKKIVSLMSGGVGCGNILKLSKIVNDQLNDDYFLCIFTGKNEKLKNKIDRKFANNERVKTIGFTLDINKYLKSSEIVLSKPGGLSSTELAVLNAPLIHLKEIPGCETSNIRYFTSNGISLLGRNKSQIIKSISSLLVDEELVNVIKENQNKYINKNATNDIINTILKV